MSDVKMLLLGDTNVGRPDPASAFASSLHLIREADIRFCNLETVVADAKYLHIPTTAATSPKRKSGCSTRTCRPELTL